MSGGREQSAAHAHRRMRAVDGHAGVLMENLRTKWRGRASTRTACGLARHAPCRMLRPISWSGTAPYQLSRMDNDGVGARRSARNCMEGGDSDRPGRGGEWFPLPMVRRSRRQRWDGGCQPRSTARRRKQTGLNPHHTAVGFAHRGILRNPELIEGLVEGSAGVPPRRRCAAPRRMQYARTRARPAVGRIVAA
jgi:hypothetical protein